MLIRDLDVALDSTRVGPVALDSTHVGPNGDAPANAESRHYGPRPHATPLTISVVIPTKNEARNIVWVLENMDPIVDQVVIVDFRSTDGTTDIARMIRPDVLVVEHPLPGKGEAIRAGFAAATGDVVVMLDADGSMDPAEIRRMVEQLASGYDLAKGSRFLAGGGTTDMTWLRRLGNAGLVGLTNILLGARYSELCYGFMALRRSRIAELGLRSTGFEIETEIVVRAHRAGLAVVEVPSFESPRRNGESNLNTFRDGWRVLITLLRQRAARMGTAAGNRELAASNLEPMEQEAT